MTHDMILIWKLNRRTGLWVSQRNCTAETAAQWLAIFQKDEPEETFIAAKRRPMALKAPR